MRGEAGQPASQSDERLQGVLQRFIYENAEGGFGIAVFADEAGTSRWVARGRLWGLSAGETVELHGRWVDDPRYGRQFLVQTARPVLPATEVGIRQYLIAARIRGVGPKLAERVVAVFGEDTLRVIAQEPERLAEIRGLGQARSQRLLATLGPRIRQDAALVFLLDQGLGPALSARIVEHYGDDAVRIVRLRPYQMAWDIDGIGFALADRVAQAQGLGTEHPLRVEAGVIHALDTLCARGDTAPFAARLEEQAVALLDCPLPLVGAACQRLIAQGRVEQLFAVRGAAAGDDEGDVSVHIGPSRLTRAEASLAADLLRLVSSRAVTLAEADARPRLAQAEQALGFELLGRQREAVARALESGVLVVTGGPGTGKTTIVLGVLAAAQVDGLRVALAAPTGRAARRLSEAAICEASTVHRLLEFDPRTLRFGRNAEAPLDADLVIVDEASMLDTPLAAGLCRALRPGARLMLVGDVDQLPSVGPGAVLEDIIRSERCDLVRLDRVHRQAEQSLIVQAAHKVRRGVLPQGADRDHPGDFYILPRESPEEILSTLLEVVCHRLPSSLGLDPFDDVQVIVPMHRGPLGTEELNRALRDALNADAEPVGEGLRVGDKVIQTRNNYDLEVYNGDIGRVIAREGDGLKVRMTDREVVYGSGASADLQLAYAITVHKSQGSEYPAVVLPLHMQHRMLLQRNLLYTGITRARRFAVLMGQPAAMARAVSNASPHHRTTLLQQRLRGELTSARPARAPQGDG